MPMLPVPGPAGCQPVQSSPAFLVAPCFRCCGSLGLVLGPSEETQEDNTSEREKAEPGALLEAYKVVCGGPQPSNPGKPA